MLPVKGTTTLSISKSLVLRVRRAASLVLCAEDGVRTGEGERDLASSGRLRREGGVAISNSSLSISLPSLSRFRFTFTKMKEENIDQLGS